MVVGRSDNCCLYAYTYFSNIDLYRGMVLGTNDSSTGRTSTQEITAYIKHIPTEPKAVDSYLLPMLSLSSDRRSSTQYKFQLTLLTSLPFSGDVPIHKFTCFVLHFN